MQPLCAARACPTLSRPPRPAAPHNEWKSNPRSSTTVCAVSLFDDPGARQLGSAREPTARMARAMRVEIARARLQCPDDKCGVPGSPA